MKTRLFTELEVWKNSHKFVLNVYKLTQLFPKCEIYGLVSQFRRAAVSIAANIAEGYKRQSKREKIRFYNISQSSIEECRYYVILSHDLGYINSKILINDLNQICSKLYGYIKSIKDDINSK